MPPINEPKRYEIVTLPDFLQVPEDRLADCLAAFRHYVELCRELQSVDGVEPIKFTWIDDEISGLSALILMFESGAEREDT